MNVHCSQEILKRVLTACATLGRAYPESTHTCLTARALFPEQPDCLEVAAWSALHTVGLIARLPAQVALPGRVMIPAKLLAKGLEGVHPGQVTLSLVEVEEPAIKQQGKLVNALKSGPALQIESARTSARGTVSTRRVRLRLPSWPQGESVALPDVAFWSATGLFLAEVKPAQLRAALAPCLALAHQRESSPHMNHAQVLVRFEAGQLQWTGTTRSSAASCQLPLCSPAPSSPVSHALFDERALRWLCAALVGMKRPVRLTLLPQAGSHVLLRVKSEQLTFFCLGETESIPFTWEARFRLPATTTLLVPRAPLQQALSFFGRVSAGRANPHLLMQATGNLLCVQGIGVDEADEPSIATLRQIPLLSPGADISSLWVNLRQMRQIVRVLKGPGMRLELGRFVRHGEQPAAREEPGAVEWLRFSSLAADPATQLMMTTSRVADAPTPAPGNEAPGQSEAAALEGAALANV